MLSCSASCVVRTAVPLLLVIIAHVVVSFPAAGGDNPSQKYGPPPGSATAAAVAQQPDAEYGPPPASLSEMDSMYGPPGFTPGEPLGPDNYATSATNNDELQVAPCPNTDLAGNKQLVLDFYQNVFGDKRFDLVDRYVAEDVINHNPMEADGRQSLLEVLKGPLGQGPPTKVDFKRISAEGDLVWLHSRIPVPALNVTYAIVDIFRINCAGIIQEHWDVIQDTNVESKNPHPFF